MAGKTTPVSNRSSSLSPNGPFAGPSIDHLLHLGPSGVVFKSDGALDIGVELAVGLHVQQHFETEEGCAKLKNRFVILEGIVVDCRHVDSMVDQPYYQISLLFDGLDEEAEEIIKLLCDQQALLNDHQEQRGYHTAINSMPTVALN